MKILFLLTLFLFGCGASQKRQPVSKEPVAAVLFFGAPWCEGCHVQIPSSIPGVPAGVESVLYVTTAGVASQPPSQEVADHYKKELGFPGKAVPDAWRWKTYRRYMPAGASYLPAAVAVDVRGGLVKRFDHPTFMADEIRSFFKAKP